MMDIFLADAHLGSPGDPNYQRLLEFLKSIRGEVRQLFLLGDLFEFWGNFSRPPRAYRPLVDMLDLLAADGVQITWVEGNHDFHLQRFFGRRQGYRVLPDGGYIALDGKTVYIAHGDLVDTQNLAYLKLRRFLRSPFAAFLARLLPLAVLDRIASRMSHESKSRRLTYDRPADLLPMLEQHASTHFASGADAVITGHYHTPLVSSHGDGVMIALGDWMQDFSYVEYRAGVFILKSYSD